MWDGEKTVIIAAGGYNGGSKLDSVEIYDLNDKTWDSGKSNSQKNYLLTYIGDLV